MPDHNVTHCQVCEPGGEPWNIGQWLFTVSPGVFGLVGGLANPSGFALIVIITVMTICSMPFVRKGGRFEVRSIEMTSIDWTVFKPFEN